MFNEAMNLSVQEKIDLRKKWLERFEPDVRELVLGPCSTETREQALILHTKTHLLYSRLEKLEDAVFHFVDEVEELLVESMELSLMFNGDFFTLKHLGQRSGDE